MKFKVTFVRHGGEDDLTFNCREDAEMFAVWLYDSSAGIDATVTEVPEEP